MNENPSGSRYRILVVEDNPADVELLRITLESAGLDCELVVIDDGGEALDFVRKRGKHAGASRPHLTILDLNLPKNDGTEILEAMRAVPEFAAAPVLVLSSSASPREIASLKQLGISRHIAKPIDLDEYLKIGPVVRNLLENPAARLAEGRQG